MPDDGTTRCGDLAPTFVSPDIAGWWGEPITDDEDEGRMPSRPATGS
jgi:hypothetical protein